jgi:hypothetical protein
MRRLYEWRDAKGNKVNINSTSATSNSSKQINDKDYKNRFTKLLDYVKAHSKAERTEIKQLNSNGFHYAEHHNDKGHGWDIDLLVATSKVTYDWAFQYYVDGKYNDGKQGEGYEDLIRALSFYINTPSVGTPEYDNLLIESKSSTIDEFKTYENLWD